MSIASSSKYDLIHALPEKSTVASKDEAHKRSSKHDRDRVKEVFTCIKVQVDQMKAQAENTLTKRLLTLSHTVEGKVRRNLQAARLAREAEQIHSLDACCPALGAEASSRDQMKPQVRNYLTKRLLTLSHKVEGKQVRAEVGTNWQAARLARRWSRSEAWMLDVWLQVLQLVPVMHSAQRVLQISVPTRGHDLQRMTCSLCRNHHRFSVLLVLAFSDA